MTLRARVIVAATVGIIVIAALVALVSVRFTAAVEAGRNVFIDAVPVSSQADSLVLSRIEAEGDLQDYILTGDPRFRAELDATVARGDANLDALRRGSADDPELAALVTVAVGAREEWWATDAEPAIAAVEAGDRAAAARITQSDSAWAAYLASVDSARAIRGLVDARRAAAFDVLAGAARELGISLVAAALVVIAASLMLLLGLRAWVLRPIEALRRQLRAAARRGEHHHPITSTGPPELIATGLDAERLRRQLVAEIDEARMAREGLAQDAPVVAAVRRELTMSGVPRVTGLHVAGLLSPAEGVLAGDWWDARLLPEGQLAVSLCDVSGHGPRAGICALRIRHVVAAVLEGGGSTADAVTSAARGFRDEEEQFATLVVMTIDPSTGVVHWTNAGHHPPLVLGDESRRLVGTGPLLSCLGGQWHEQTTHLKPAQTILAFTDGLLESHDSGGRQLQEEGIEQLVQMWRVSAAGSSPEELIAQVTASARERAADWRRDDVTVVAVARS